MSQTHTGLRLLSAHRAALAGIALAAALVSGAAAGPALTKPPAVSAAAPMGAIAAPAPRRSEKPVAHAAADALGSTLTRLAALAPSLDRRVLQLALEARRTAALRGIPHKADVLTVIDYSLPSTAKRLWVFDVASGKLLFHELVAHGKGTGDNYAERFSNADGSEQTSLGLFVTGDTYLGKNGYSLKLAGLEPGFNDLAASRAVVMHGAAYVSPQFAAEHGRLGRSWGCPALDQAVAPKLIDTIKGGTLMFSYFPAQSWLAASSFLHAATTTALAAAR